MARAVRSRPFTATLARIEGKGGWTYVTVPPALTPKAAGAWGRLPVRATVDGITWDTSLWRTKRGDGFLPVPKRVRGSREAGVRVRVSFELLDPD